MNQCIRGKVVPFWKQPIIYKVVDWAADHYYGWFRDVDRAEARAREVHGLVVSQTVGAGTRFLASIRQAGEFAKAAAKMDANGGRLE